ncbi:MAG: hypothetical protein H7232_13255 [Aeromicrobium sp.]|nr:hypothetical protein [Burkholderiales bacterium]
MGIVGVRTRNPLACTTGVKKWRRVMVYASENLTARISAAGEVRYAGSLVSVPKTLRDSGFIEAL